MVLARTFCRVCTNLAFLVLCKRPVSMLIMIRCGRTHLVVPTRRPLLSSRLLSWLARTWLLRLIVVIALRAGRLRQSTRRQSTPLARRPAKDLPVPVTLPGGSVSSPKWRDRPPKVAPLRLDESLVHLSEVGPPVQSDKPKRGRRPVTDTHTLHR